MIGQLSNFKGILVCVSIFFFIAGNIYGQATRLVSPGGSNSGNCISSACATINYAISQAVDGDIILVNDGVYAENISLNKNISLLSVNGKGSTIIEGSNTSNLLGTIHIFPGRNGVTIGAASQGFTVLGIDGTAGLEKAAIYLQGAQNNTTIEGNEIVARGDAALLGEYNAAISGLVVNDNIFSGSTFTGAPAGDGFAAQFTLLNVPRQVVVFGGGASTSNTQNITFTNNTVSATAGGISTTDNDGNTVAEHPQGNTLVTLDAIGEVIITDNTFSGTTAREAEALRTRGAGTHTITGNIFNGNYPIIYSAATNPITVGEARAQYVYDNNTMSGTVSGHKILNCAPQITIADVNTVAGQAANTIFLGYGPSSVTLEGTITGNSTYTYYWTSGTGDTYAQNPIIVAPTTTTTYTFTATDDVTSCSQSRSITIYVVDVRDGNKIYICCNNKTNSVPVSAVPAHLDHGDKLGQCPLSKSQGSEDIAENKGLFKIYPNPTNGVFILELETKEKAEVLITNVQGQRVGHNYIEESLGSLRFDVNDLATGIYFLRVLTETGIIYQVKLIVR